MPRGDRTGPAGLGPLTGRAAGYCAGHYVPGFLDGRVGIRGWPNLFLRRRFIGRIAPRALARGGARGGRGRRRRW